MLSAVPAGRMTVAVVCGNLEPTIGGGSSLCQSLLDGLLKILPTIHERRFLLFSKAKKVPDKYASLKMISYKEENLNKKIKKNACDLVWFMSGGGFPEPAEIPYIATIWDLQHRQLPFLPEIQQNREWEYREEKSVPFIGQATRLIVGTERGKEEVCRNYGVDPARIRIVPLPLTAEPGTPKSGKPKNKKEPFLFYPAQFWPHKNHVVLIKALHLLRGKNIPIRLVCPGDDKGNLQKIRSWVKRLELGDAVEFPGFLSDGEIQDLYSQALALVFPSLAGPDNLPPLEAMASGCPVVQAALEGPQEQLGEAAFYADPFRPEAWAAIIEKLLKTEFQTEVIRKKEKGRELVQKRTPAEYLRKILDIVDELGPIVDLWK